VELELEFWKASAMTVAIEGAREGIEEFHRHAVATGVVSNCSFSQDVLRYELAKYGLAEHLAFVMVSAEYAVRKPNVLLFETAAAKLGVEPGDIWFVGDRLDTDLTGAKAAGMTAVWLRPAEGEKSDIADLRAGSWDEIVELFHRAPE